MRRSETPWIPKSYRRPLSPFFLGSVPVAFPTNSGWYASPSATAHLGHALETTERPRAYQVPLRDLEQTFNSGQGTGCAGGKRKGCALNWDRANDISRNSLTGKQTSSVKYISNWASCLARHLTGHCLQLAKVTAWAKPAFRQKRCDRHHEQPRNWYR
jgi:hypothetical protein